MTLYRDAVRVKKIEHTEVQDGLIEAYSILSGWGDRFAATPGADARFILKDIDNASDAIRRALISVETALGLEPKR